MMDRLWFRRVSRGHPRGGLARVRSTTVRVVDPRCVSCLGWQVRDRSIWHESVQWRPCSCLCLFFFFFLRYYTFRSQCDPQWPRISTWSGYDSPSLKRAAILPGNQWNQRFRNTGCLARFTGNPRPPALKKIIHHHYLSKGGSEPPHFRVLGAAKTPLFQNPWEICNFSMHFQYISPQNNGVLWCSVRSIFLESHLELTPVALRSEKVGRREACTSLLILHLDDRKWRDQRLRI